MGFSELLINSESLKDIRQFAELINRSGKRLLNVIEDLFMVSSIISKSVRIEPRKVKLAEFIDDVKIMLHDEHMSFSNQNVTLDFNISNKLNGQQVNIDPSIYMLVIKKLARNAFKFTPSGNVEFGLFDLNSKGITLYIKDTGIGIDPSKQELIFHYFRQGDENLTRLYGGTGTGLSISKSLIELSNGKIWVNSALGKGSVFYFTMPVNNGHPAVDEYASEKYKINADNLLDGKNVLIVEDDNFNFLLLDAFLYGTGAKVIHAKTGEEAISAVEKNRNIDLVLMDLRMPDISGFEITRKLKKLNPAIPIIAQSALTMPEDIEKALMAGCDEYIAKPMTNASLMEKIAMVLK
jgi:CheY-like chemotaxis protein